MMSQFDLTPIWALSTEQMGSTGLTRQELMAYKPKSKSLNRNAALSLFWMDEINCARETFIKENKGD